MYVLCCDRGPSLGRTLADTAGRRIGLLFGLTRSLYEQGPPCSFFVQPSGFPGIRAPKTWTAITTEHIHRALLIGRRLAKCRVVTPRCNHNVQFGGKCRK